MKYYLRKNLKYRKVIGGSNSPNVEDAIFRLQGKVLNNMYKLPSNKNITTSLDFGCGQGSTVNFFHQAGYDAYGIDISSYAIGKSNSKLKKKLFVGNALSLPFKDNFFDLVLSINTIHNLEKQDCILALKEIMRVSKKHRFIQVDSYYSQKQKKLFENWVLTAKYHDYPDEWRKLFKIANYKGNYYWTILK